MISNLKKTYIFWLKNFETYFVIEDVPRKAHLSLNNGFHPIFNWWVTQLAVSIHKYHASKLLLLIFGHAFFLQACLLKWFLLMSRNHFQKKVAKRIYGQKLYLLHTNPKASDIGKKIRYFLSSLKLVIRDGNLGDQLETTVIMSAMRWTITLKIVRTFLLLTLICRLSFFDFKKII